MLLLIPHYCLLFANRYIGQFSRGILTVLLPDPGLNHIRIVPFLLLHLSLFQTAVELVVVAHREVKAVIISVGFDLLLRQRHYPVHMHGPIVMVLEPVILYRVLRVLRRGRCPLFGQLLVQRRFVQRHVCLSCGARMLIVPLLVRLVVEDVMGQRVLLLVVVVVHFAVNGHVILLLLAAPRLRHRTRPRVRRFLSERSLVVNGTRLHLPGTELLLPDDVPLVLHDLVQEDGHLRLLVAGHEHALPAFG